MLGQAIGGSLPAAVAIALSPIPIVAVVLVLRTPRARTVGPAFAVGWVIGLAVTAAGLALLLGGADQAGSEAATWVNWLKVAIGALFLGLAAKQWRARPKRGEPAEAPAWMASLDAISTPKAALLGTALSSVNPKNLALVATAAASIAQAGLDPAGTAAAVAVFVVLGSITVAGAVGFYIADADRATPPLAAIERFMSDNNAVIMMVVLLLLAAKSIGDGVGGLSS